MNDDTSSTTRTIQIDLVRRASAIAGVDAAAGAGSIESTSSSVAAGSVAAAMAHQVTLRVFRSNQTHHDFNEIGLTTPYGEHRDIYGNFDVTEIFREGSNQCTFTIYRPFYIPIIGGGMSITYHTKIELRVDGALRWSGEAWGWYGLGIEEPLKTWELTIDGIPPLPPPPGPWDRLPGRASDIAVGADGTACVVGANRVPGGFGVFRWTGSTWTHLGGGAMRIAVDPSGNPWIVNDQWEIFRYVDGHWQLHGGRALDIGIGADGAVWVIGNNAVPGGFGIYRLSGGQWQAIPGGAVRISVGPNGLPWVTNNKGEIFRFDGGNWTLVAGWASDIGVGADGTVWVIGGDERVFRRVGADWAAIPGTAIQIAVGPDGRAWATNKSGVIYRLR